MLSQTARLNGPQPVAAIVAPTGCVDDRPVYGLLGLAPVGLIQTARELILEVQVFLCLHGRLICALNYYLT